MTAVAPSVSIGAPEFGQPVGVAGAGRLGVHDGEAARHPRRLVDRADRRARVARVKSGARRRLGRRRAELVVDRPVGDVARRPRSTGCPRRSPGPSGPSVSVSRGRETSDVDAVLDCRRRRCRVSSSTHSSWLTQFAVPVGEHGLRHAVDERRHRGCRRRRAAAATPGNVAPFGGIAHAGGRRREAVSATRRDKTPPSHHSCPSYSEHPHLKQRVWRMSALRSLNGGGPPSGPGDVSTPRPQSAVPTASSCSG